MTYIWNFLKGFFIGLANLVPGVSGGTIAVLTGIYDRLIGAVSGFVGGGEGGWRANLRLLVPVALGAGAALLGFSGLLAWARDHVPLQTSLFFLGLILGSLPFLFALANRDGWHWSYLIGFVLGAALVIYLAFLRHQTPMNPGATTGPQDVAGYLWFFVSAVAGMGAMVVPGVSGSFVLLLMGSYDAFINALKDRNFLMLLVFALGAGLGLLLITKVLNLVFRRWHGHSYWAILGLVLGSGVDIALRALDAPSIQASAILLEGVSWPLAIATLVLGGGAALLLSGRKKLEHQEEIQGMEAAMEAEQAALDSPEDQDSSKT